MHSQPEPRKRCAQYSLLDARLARRSRRVGQGMRLNGGAVAYASAHKSVPLSLAEEAALAFAACGITGYTMADLPYDTGNVAEAGGGNIIMNFVGRTAFSADAAHVVTVFVINDDGAWLLKRPQDFPRLEVPKLVQAAREQRWLDLYEKSRNSPVLGAATCMTTSWRGTRQHWASSILGCMSLLPSSRDRF